MWIWVRSCDEPDKILAAILDVFDRTAKLHRRHRDQKFVGVEQQHFLTEPAADVWRNHPHLVLIQAEHRCEPAANRDRRLGTVPYGEFAGDRVPARSHGPAFHRRGGRAIDLYRDPRDMLGARKRSIRIARGLDEMRGEIIRHVRVHQRRAVLQRFVQIHLDRQRLEFHIDHCRRIFRGIAVDRDHHGDGLADIKYVAPRQRPLRLRVFHRRMRNEQRHRDVEHSDIAAGIDRGHARVIARCRGIEFDNACARERAAQERGVQHIGQRDVVDERAFAAQQLRVDVALDAGAKCAGRHGGIPRQARPSNSAARRTAAMMLM